MTRNLPAILLLSVMTLAASRTVSAEQGTRAAACTPPRVAIQPNDATVERGQGVTLSVGVVGDTPLQFQWYRGFMGDTAAPVGTNSSQLVLTNLTDTARYWVRVTNACGTTDSVEALVTVRLIFSGLRFVPVTPCRAIDTRGSGSGGPILGGTIRELSLAGLCNVPADALALSANFTATGFTNAGYISVYSETGFPSRAFSTMNFTPGQWALANGALVALRSGAGLTVFSSADTHMIIDVNGYFVSQDGTNAGTALRFTSVTPCRIEDTRTNGGSLAYNSFRGIAIAGQCGIPTGVTAVSGNFTVTELPANGFLSAYPETGTLPRQISLMNYTAGQWALANGGIVGLRSFGAMNVYASAPAQVILDVNGYFSSSGYAFYPVTPCRLQDTRYSGGIMNPNSSRQLLVAGLCNVPSDARAVSANFTVTEFPGNGYLSVYPESGNLPRPISLLNFTAGQWALANGGIVPLSPGGSVTMYVASSPAHVIVDVNGYFK